MGPMRVYGLDDIRRMTVINACREIDMPIAAIQDLMAALSVSPSQQDAARIFEDALHARKRELAAQQSILRRQMQRISELLESAADGDNPERVKRCRPSIFHRSRQSASPSWPKATRQTGSPR